MLIYSKTIVSFLKRVRSDLRSILKDELGLKTYRTRFLFNNRLIPFDIVVFEDNSRLGYFEPHFYRIGINKRLMYQAKRSVIKDIIRHELMHFITWLEYGDEALSHSLYFKETCQKFNYDKSVYEAYTNLNLSNEKIEGDLKSEKIINKVKKLLKLAESSNTHEAELATIKANELLLKHNLSLIPKYSDEHDIEICVKRVLSGIKATAKHQAIYEILKTFFVSPVFNYGKKIFYLEVTGPRANTEMAEYVASFLDTELERIYKLEKKIKPEIKKASFMHGVGVGYVEKINSNQRSSTSGKELITLKNVLKEQVEMAYKKLSHRAVSSKNDHNSISHGKKIGQKLSINPAVKNKSSKKFLGFF